MLGKTLGCMPKMGERAVAEQAAEPKAEAPVARDIGPSGGAPARAPPRDRDRMRAAVLGVPPPRHHLPRGAQPVSRLCGCRREADTPTVGGLMQTTA